MCMQNWHHRILHVFVYNDMSCLLLYKLLSCEVWWFTYFRPITLHLDTSAFVSALANNQCCLLALYYDNWHFFYKVKAVKKQQPYSFLQCFFLDYMYQVRGARHQGKKINLPCNSSFSTVCTKRMMQTVECDQKAGHTKCELAAQTDTAAASLWGVCMGNLGKNTDTAT